MQRYCRVAIDSPVFALDRPFDYEIPERMLGRVDVGSVVRVNLHGRNMRAFVVTMLDEAAVAKPRALSSLVSEEPLFTADTIALAKWTARRYIVPLGAVLHDAVPGRFSAPARTSPARASADPMPRPSFLQRDLPLDGESCVVVPSVDDEPVLAQYVVSRARARGRSALVICPRVEIAEQVARAVEASVLLHGEERPADRAAAWAAARSGEADVVVGGRSALFVPMPHLGVVVVVSTHDRALRSERTPRLHAMHVARERARASGCAFVVSSPVPPVEFAAAQGVGLVESKRGRVRPEVARPRKGPVTERLLDVVRSAIGHGADALVFVARKGDVLRLRCTDCGWTPSCARCGSGLALERPVLRCRVCGTTTDAPDMCRPCGGALSERGWGHERVARAIEKAIETPVHRVVRGSEPADAAGPKVVVGTLAAAHGGARFGAIAVADLDQMLSRPDFRAAEQALQTLHELAGALRPDGRFLVQSREPEHQVVQSFTRGSYRYFLDRELGPREETGYPPFGAVVRVELAADALADLERTLARSGARVVGAVPRRGRMIALVRAPDVDPILGPLRSFAIEHPRTKVDVDPTDLA